MHIKLQIKTSSFQKHILFISFFQVIWRYCSLCDFYFTLGLQLTWQKPSIHILSNILEFWQKDFTTTVKRIFYEECNILLFFCIPSTQLSCYFPLMSGNAETTNSVFTRSKILQMSWDYIIVGYASLQLQGNHR